jgi:hypothetical protein
MQLAMLDPNINNSNIVNKKHAKHEGKSTALLEVKNNAGDKRKTISDTVAARALDALSSDYDSDVDNNSDAPLASRRTTSTSVKRKERKIEAGGVGRAMQKKYPLGHLKPLFNGKCCQ